jgi:transaldolase
MKSINSLDRQEKRTLSALRTRILLDGGDPIETIRIRELIGFVDGQTTNPSLVAKNPQIEQKLASRHRLTEQQAREAYKQIVQQISPHVGVAGVSIEVFANLDSTADEMLSQAREMYTWIPNAYIKFPCTLEGLKAAHLAVNEQIQANITLCFSQEQAAAVYAATLGTPVPVYVSPFVGRLDDIGFKGVDLLANIQRMFLQGDGHVQLLAASIRTLDHLLYCLNIETDLATVPAKVLVQWAAEEFPMPGRDFTYPRFGTPIPYIDLDLRRPLESFDVSHELTRKGIQKFVEDYKATISAAA